MTILDTLNLRVDLIPDPAHDGAGHQLNDADLIAVYQALMSIDPHSLAPTEIDPVYENVLRIRQQLIDRQRDMVGQRTGMLHQHSISQEENERRWQEERSYQFRADGLSRLLKKLDQLP